MQVLKRYIKVRMLGSIGTVLSMMVAPMLWGLLAFTGVLTSSAITGNGAPLARTALTIALAGLLFASVAGPVVAAILVFLKRPRFRLRPLLRALYRYSSRNVALVVFASATGCVFALSCYFLGIDAIGAVMASALAIGSVPLFGLAIQAVMNARWVQRLTGITCEPLLLNGASIVAHAVVVLMLFLFLLLTFDTVNVVEWPGLLKAKMLNQDKADLLRGVLYSLGYGLLWALYLVVTSRWPSRHNRDPIVLSEAEHTLADDYFEATESGPDVRQDSEMMADCDLLEILLVRVGLVQFFSFSVLVIMAIVLRCLGVAPGPDTLAGQCLLASHELVALPARLRVLPWLPSACFGLIMLLPSFIAYVLINERTQRYEEVHGSGGVTAETWNDVLAFLEPFTAMFFGILVVPMLHPALGDVALFAHPQALLGMVVACFALVLWLKLTGIFRSLRDRDIHAYVQKLEKVYDDHLKDQVFVGSGNPGSSGGLKDSDWRLIESCASRMPQYELRKRFYELEDNLREQAHALLECQQVWPGFSRYRSMSDSDRSHGRCGTELLSLPEQEGPASKLLVDNFDFLNTETLFARHSINMLVLPRYSEAFPVHAAEWRELEKALYLLLTGSLWFKLKRFTMWTLPASALHSSYEFFESEFMRMTRHSVVLRRGPGGWLAHQAWLQAQWDNAGAPVSWRAKLRDVCPHILDTDHMVRGLKGQLQREWVSIFGHGQKPPEPTDKLLFLLVPKAPAVTVLEHGELAAHYVGGGAPGTVLSAVSLEADIVRHLNQWGGVEPRATFRRSVLGNPFVLYNHSESEKLGTAEG